MEVIYQNNTTYIVKVSDDIYYYGNGISFGMLGSGPDTFLRFNPYMKEVTGVNIPKIVRYDIKKIMIDMVEEGLLDTITALGELGRGKEVPREK